jgi:PleD family two-component response regulator
MSERDEKNVLHGPSIADVSAKPIMVLLVGETARSSLPLLRWLNRRGCRCQLAGCYREACNLISGTQFELVLSEYQLPDRTAFPLLDRLAGSRATLYFSTLVEGGSLWLKMLERGERCVGAPVVRSSDLATMLGSVLDAAVESYEKKTVSAA